MFLEIFLTVFVGAQLSIYVFYNRRRVQCKGFLGVVLSIFIYSLFYSFEITSFNLTYMKYLQAIKYIGILFIPAFWLIVVLEYTNRSIYITKSSYIGIFFMPICLIILNFTNDYHHFFYKSYSYNVVNFFSIENIKPGIGYEISIIYVIICIFIGSVFQVEHFIKNRDIYIKRNSDILIISLIFWFGYAIYMFGIIHTEIDIAPAIIEVVCLIYAYVLLKSDDNETLTTAKHIAFDNIKESIIVLSMDNKIVNINRRASELFEKKSNSIIGEDICELFKNYKEFIKHINDNKDKTFDFEIKEESCCFKCKINIVNRRRSKFKILILSDNTKQNLLIRRLLYYATTDSLTGVYNRNYFFKVANAKIQDSIKSCKGISLLMIDLDKFKIINDTYGHAVGDIVIKRTMEACKKVLDKNCCIGRYGGEEFAILLESVNDKQALETGEKIRAQIEKSLILEEGKYIKITVSIGIFSSTREESLENMLKFADEALYKAKNSGRNRVVMNATNN